MITISLCMIVKNEEDILARCLDSLADLMDEIIIVDTGSTDGTKEIAKKYTDKVYDFEWTYDFAEARNFAFSKATKGYIYSADADEVLNDFNREKLRQLKETLDPDVEIVRMKYLTPASFRTAMNDNSRNNYRRILYKRLREFKWIDPIRETIRMAPVVFDSDIEIQHMPQELHSKRDFKIFLDTFDKEGELSVKLHTMYAKELYINGTLEDFTQAWPIFTATLADNTIDKKRRVQALCIYIKWARLANNRDEFMKAALYALANEKCAEVLFELGVFYLDDEAFPEATRWFEDAIQAQPVLDEHVAGDKAYFAAAEAVANQAKLMKRQEKYDRAVQASLENKARRLEAMGKSWSSNKFYHEQE